MKEILTTPQRFDTVGSFLRPERLKKARKDFEEGSLSQSELTKIEDECIIELVRKQKEIGLQIITDGEFRRKTWHLDFMWGFKGVGHQPTQTGIPFHNEQAMIDDTYLIGKVSVDHHPFVEHFKFIKQFEDEHTIAKQTIPSPAQFLEQMILPMAIENTNKYYSDKKELMDDIVTSYKKIIQELYEVGCRHIQLDDCSWGLFVDSRACEIFQTDKQGLQVIMEQFIYINNAVIEGIPEDLIINTHVCRGNFNSTWASSGAYDKVAHTLFEKEKVNAFYLEFDDERSGNFESLAHVSGDKKVVLGLITTKSPTLEKEEDIIARIYEASQYIPLDRLYLSPQCGFASCEIGNKLTEQQQWDKIKLVKDIARKVWK